MSYFFNKVVAITGGSDGIGKALVDSLLALGAKVATCGRSYDKLYSLQLQYASAPLHTITCDVSNEHDCQNFIESTIKTFGRIDILINNAGISMRSLFKDADFDVMKQIMDVNYWGAVYCTKYALDSIIANKGTIVGMSSVAGYRGLPGKSAYSASKFALQGWMEALRVEMMDQHVNVMWICPGFTTDEPRRYSGESPIDEETPIPPEECAAITLDAIEKQKRYVIMTFSGKRTVFSTRFFPTLADKFIHKYFFKDGKLVK
ncbi:MAG: SDR family oxidoreductase [Chitinophagaceae bacterium]|nr:SDR family oxidoreductase [Chitinophagaceae bacterium]